MGPIKDKISIFAELVIIDFAKIEILFLSRDV